MEGIQGLTEKYNKGTDEANTHPSQAHVCSITYEVHALSKDDGSGIKRPQMASIS